jgi:ATP-dependent DNA ligase
MPKKKHNPLYHKGKAGKIFSWEVWTEGKTVFTKHGSNDGEKVTTPHLCIPKNTGKKNETTAEEQANKEAAAMHKKKLDGKYFESINEAKTGLKLRPMLASDFFKRKDKLIYPLEEQPKLDGARCLAYWSDGKVCLTSRGGKEYNLPHIKEELESFLPEWAILDGEIYDHNKTFQETMRLVKKLRDETPELNYCPYDAISRDKLELPWHMRKKLLWDIIKKDTKSIKLVETITCANEKEVLKVAADFVADGYEGGIVRQLGGLYQFGFRSHDLLKVKNFVDAEFEITDFGIFRVRLVENKKPKMIDCVVWTCKTLDGKEFNVVPKGSAEERNAMLQDAKKQIGKMLTVKYFELSDDGIPRFPVGLHIRESL